MRQVESARALPSGGLVHITGDGSGAPLLFLHGVGGAAWSWDPQVREFAASRPCFVWEARGHGAAARVADAGLGDYWTDAREALAAVRAQTRRDAVVIGHSMGGLLALVLAAEEPGVAAAVLVDPVYPDGGASSGHSLGPFTPLAIALMKPLVRSFLDDGPIARTISRWMFTQSFTDRAKMEAAWPQQRRQIPIEYPKMFFEAFGVPEGFPVRNFGDEITVPVLAFNLRSRAGVATLRRRLGDAFVDVRMDGGHYLQLDRPAAVNERLTEFLRERTGS